MVVTGRPREFDRDAALDAAMRVFWRKGFQSASMNDLCDAMRIRSPSVYAAFGSKEALYLETMDRYGRTVGSAFWERVERAETARAGVEAMLRAATETMPASCDGPSGCMAMLAAVSDDWPEGITEAARAMRAGCLEMLRARLSAAVAGGELAPSVDVDGMARLYFGIFQGMAIQARDGASPAQLAGIVDGAMGAWPG